MRSRAQDPDDRRERRLYAAVVRSRRGGESTKRIYHLGRPRFTDDGATACVRVDADDRPLFEFNRAFFDGLGPTELIFVLLHEAMHLAFHHHQRRGDRGILLWNLACDLVVNEFLLGRAGFGQNMSPAFRRFIQNAATMRNCGPKSLRVKPGEWTAEQVYDLLKRHEEESVRRAAETKAIDRHTWEQGDDDTGGGTVMTGHALDEMAEQAAEALADCMPGAAGTHALGELRQADRRPPRPVPWQALLRQRLAAAIDQKVESQWRPSRKIAYLHPRVLLPSDRDVDAPDKPTVLLALDASGSVDRSLLTEFLAIARSIPRDRAIAKAISFDTQAYAIDLWADPVEIRGGGGTSFQCIEQYAMSLPRRPALVVVLTDGEAPPPKLTDPSRWVWLLSPGGIDAAVRGLGTVWRIQA